MVKADELVDGVVEMEPFHGAAIDVSPGIEEQNHPTEASTEQELFLGDRNSSSLAFATTKCQNGSSSKRKRAIDNFGKNCDEGRSSFVAAQSSTLPPPSNDNDTYIGTRSLRVRTKVAPRKQERLFSCPQCERSFMNHHHLKRHQSDVHSELRPFECKKCGSAFKRRSDMLKHSTRYCRKTKKKITNCGYIEPLVHPPATEKGEYEEESKPKTFIDEYKHWLSSIGAQRCNLKALVNN